MTRDNNKGITGIYYNHLNLPTEVRFDHGGKILYTYDATGVKLSKRVITSSNVSSYTYYAGNYIYEQDSNGEELKFFSHPEGFVEKNGSSFDYVYQYKDHLGNVRLNYADINNDGNVNSSEIKEENNYYPFGLKHKGSNNVIVGRDHKYGYGGKEEQDELGLEWHDFHARNFDVALGRWMNVDPLAEKYYAYSSYAYVMNNPLRYTDPTGMSAEDPIYGTNIWGNLKYLGDDGQDNGRVYFVKGKVKRDVKRATKDGEFYSGSLDSSDKVSSVPKSIKGDIEESVNNTLSSKRENGAHISDGDDGATHWDEGPEVTQITSESDGITKTKTRGTVEPFKVDGERPKMDYDKLDVYWHVHPNTKGLGGSRHSSGAHGNSGDLPSQRVYEAKGYKGNPFVIGAGDKRLRFYNSKGSIMKIKYNQFLKVL